ncbi:MAG TPA: hypothetical protein VEX35_12250 [Allosphingosinicella sp.]|nr:hypothetical protein [Allosphingosinicella sp.]
MSTLTAERLYALLPSVYRLRDAEQEGEPLRALIAALAEQFAVLEENIEQLYDDQFIETCANWAAPYIGDVIGYRPLHGIPADLFSARAEIGNTIANRRRKGTALVLEELASNVTGWPASAVEYFERLATTQYMKHSRLHAPATANLRNLTGCLREGSAFAPFSHTAEMRSPEGGAGRYNIPNVGLHLWRLLPLRLTAVPLVPHPGDASGLKFRVNPLGADLQLFRRPRAEEDIAHLAEPINVPEPLSVRLMALAVKAAQLSLGPAPDLIAHDDFGPEESIALLRPAPPSIPPAPPIPVSVEDIVICDLRDMPGTGGAVWNHEQSLPQLRPPLPPGKIGLDPERGRVLLENASLGPLLATFHYGTTKWTGGGDYERTPPGQHLPTQATIKGTGALPPLLNDLQTSLNAIAVGGRLQIEDSLSYAATAFTVDPATPLHPELEVVVAATNSCRPLVVGPKTGITLTIAARGRLVLDGIVFGGGPLTLAAAADSAPRELVLRDCTLVPGLSLDRHGSALSPGEPSLRFDHPFGKVTLLRCITGPLIVAPDVEVEMKDCIVDAGATDSVAFAGDLADGAGASLTVRESTIVGRVHCKRMDLASNSIFFASLDAPPAIPWLGPVVAQRRQEGCMRFCYVPAGSVTPRRFRCVPGKEDPDAMPHFTSLRYGDAAYGQLRRVTGRSIRMGADDASEMGVLHDLYQPQREDNLRVRLDEYMRFGLRAGIFYAT